MCLYKLWILFIPTFGSWTGKMCVTKRMLQDRESSEKTVGKWMRYTIVIKSWVMGCRMPILNEKSVVMKNLLNFMSITKACVYVNNKNVFNERVWRNARLLNEKCQAGAWTVSNTRIIPHCCNQWMAHREQISNPTKLSY